MHLTLPKVETDEITAIIIALLWPTSKWWDKLKELLVERPIRLGDHQTLLTPQGRGDFPGWGL